MILIKGQTELQTPIYTREELSRVGALVFRAYTNNGMCTEILVYGSKGGYNIDSSKFWNGDSISDDELLISPANFRSVWDSALEYLTPQF